MFIPDPVFLTHPGSRGQKSIGSCIRILNTGFFSYIEKETARFAREIPNKVLWPPNLPERNLLLPPPPLPSPYLAAMRIHPGEARR
jgi:hypothetical protein